MRNARLGSFSRIFPDLTGLASEFAFQLTAKAFAHAIRDRAGNAASFWKAASFVIPSEVEESLAIQEIIRDVSTSLDMTEMRGRIPPKDLEVIYENRKEWGLIRR